MAARHLGVEELSVGAGGPEGGAVRAPEHLAAIGGVGVEAVGTPVAARNIETKLTNTVYIYQEGMLTQIGKMSASVHCPLAAGREVFEMIASRHDHIQHFRASRRSSFSRCKEVLRDMSENQILK